MCPRRIRYTDSTDSFSNVKSKIGKKLGKKKLYLYIYYIYININFFSADFSPKATKPYCNCQYCQ